MASFTAGNGVTLRRAAIDIGSGATKVLVADYSAQGLERILHGEEVPVMFGWDFVQSGEAKALSEEVQKKGLETLAMLKAKAEGMGAHDFSGIATEVFRKAKNGEAYLERVREMGIPVVLVSQDLEAELGYKTAVAMASILQHGPPVGIAEARAPIVYDSGGASFQITTEETGEGPLIAYTGRLGTSVSVGILVGTSMRPDVRLCSCNSL
jgi:exopolyphosphatase / guanosine-5'-triphosphate,3'-diphosphate pyrophosphatase